MYEPMRDPMHDPIGKTLHLLSAALDGGATSSVRLVEAFLARIAAHDKQGAAINAMIALDPRAHAQAEQSDRERASGLVRGPLHGIPIVVKDNIDIAGLATTAGCAVLRDHRPARDAEVVRRLRDAGAILLGKTNMSELACSNGRHGYSSMGGLTLNPYNRARNAAGSSSGSAAAVAAGFAPAALGTDSFGSVRAPACVTGLVGLRPTHGLVPVDGVLPLALSFDTVGPMALCVSDVAVLLHAMAGTRADVARAGYLNDLRQDAARGARIGVAVDFPGQDEEVRALMQEAHAQLRDLGATLVPWRSPAPADRTASGADRREDAAGASFDTAYMQTLYPSLLAPLAEAEWPAQLDAYLAAGPGPRDMTRLLQAAQAWSAAHPDREVNPRTLAGLRRALELARTQTAAQRAEAESALAAYRAAVAQSMREEALSAVVFPTLSCPASPRYDREDASYVSYPGNPYAGLYIASACGLPEISVPAGMARAGVPVGLSFMGAPYDEARLLGLAFAFEQARGGCLAATLD